MIKQTNSALEKMALGGAGEWSEDDDYSAMRRRQQNGLCFFCGGALGSFSTKDHLIPLSRGGSSGWANIVLSHSKCNREKANRMPTHDERLRFRIVTGEWPKTTRDAE